MKALEHSFLMLILLVSLFLTSVTAAELPALPKNLNPAVRENAETVGKRFLTLEECVFLVQAYHPTDPNVTQLGLCFRSEKKTQGIYAQDSCVASIVEPFTLLKREFYGSSGDWGTEGKCSKESLLKEFQRSEERKLNSPVKAFRDKRAEGQNLRVLRDRLDLETEFLKLTKP